ncbi:MAG: DNA replication and repair protein RecF [Candidatus Saccharimonadaceae bacterium]|nr:DNA replication and repair protein RecF [Candidatus Saccharimonadaceae bacterium]
MIINSVKLSNFRNHSSYFLQCTDNTSLILGKNGSGKTSVLEAIYILTQGKSFRATDHDIIKRGADFYRAEIAYNNGESSTVTYDGSVKTFIVMNKKTRRLPAKNKYPVILFQPSDLNLIDHAPSRRRTYFDRIFSQFDSSYASALYRYDKAIRQRNELLKSDAISPDSVFSWNIMLSKYGADLYSMRQQFIQEINLFITDTYRSIASNKDNVKILYQTSVSSPDESKYLKILEANFEKDHYLGHTSFGIHHDDYVFNFNNAHADGSASRGESRSLILALKFIEANLIYTKSGKRPIILLDDVFSELDPVRRKCLVRNFQDNQVIITSVEDIANIQNDQ